MTRKVPGKENCNPLLKELRLQYVHKLLWLCMLSHGFAPRTTFHKPLQMASNISLQEKSQNHSPHTSQSPPQKMTKACENPSSGRSGVISGTAFLHLVFRSSIWSFWIQICIQHAQIFLRTTDMFLSKVKRFPGYHFHEGFLLRAGYRKLKRIHPNPLHPTGKVLETDNGILSSVRTAGSSWMMQTSTWSNLWSATNLNGKSC